MRALSYLKKPCPGSQKSLTHERQLVGKGSKTGNSCGDKSWPTLVIALEGFGRHVIHLKLGTNRVGRDASNDFRIMHRTLSTKHCEIMLSPEGLAVRGCNSTNGTFVNCDPVTLSQPCTGQTLRVGEVELLVEQTEATIAVHGLEVLWPAPPVVLQDGSLICNRHPRTCATYQCSHCREVPCDGCVHRLRRRGGRTLVLCPLCSHQCRLLGGDKRKRNRPSHSLKRPSKQSLCGFLDSPAGGGEGRRSVLSKLSSLRIIEHYWHNTISEHST